MVKAKSLQKKETMEKQPTANPGRPWLIPSVLVGVASIFAITGAFDLFGSRAPDSTDYAARTQHILSSTPLIDGHNDLPYLLRMEIQNQIYDNKTFTFRDGNAILNSSMTTLACHTDHWQSWQATRTLNE